MATMEVTHQVAGEAMGEEIDLQAKMTASSVVALGIGQGTALHQVVAEVEVVLRFLHVLGLVVVVGTALAGNGIVTWRIVMMGDAMEIEIVLRAETTNMAPVIAMSMTGMHPVEIDSQAIGMVVQIVTLKMVMAKTEAMIGMLPQEGVGTGMQVGVQHVMRVGATGTGQVLMTALTEEGAPRRLTAIRHSKTALC